MEKVINILTISMFFVMGLIIGGSKLSSRPKSAMEECRDITLVNRLDEEMFTLYDKFQEDVIKLLDDSYGLPESDKFDGTGIYILNKRLVNFSRSIKLLRQQRDALVEENNGR